MTNNKTTKRTLVTTIMAMLLCISMFVGTTFAWFTDSVSNNNNIITSGNLDVELWHCNNNKAYWGFGYDEKSGEQVDENTAFFLNAEGEQILWEPGAEAGETFRVKNVGSLALKFQLHIKTMNATKTEDGKDLTDILDVQIIELVNDENGVPGHYIGDVNYDNHKLGDGYVMTGELLPGETADFNVAIGWIPSENDNDYNVAGGLKVDFAVDLLATQMSHESDAWGNSYDKDAWVEGMVVADGSSLQTAINRGETNILLMQDIVLDETIVIPASAGSARSASTARVINLNGKTISGTAEKQVHVIENRGELTIIGGTISSLGADGGSAINNLGTLTVIDSTLNGAPFVGADGWWPSYAVNNQGTMTITDSVINAEHGGVASTNGGVATLNNVTVTAGKNATTGAAVYTSNGGSVIINGGTYTNRATDQNATGASVINGAVTVNAGTFNGRIENYYGTPVIKGGTYDNENAEKWLADGYKVVKNGDFYYAVADSVDNVVTSAEELQAALDAATGETIILLGADITGDVIVSQKENANIIIDGKEYNYDGTIYVYGNSRYTGEETLTVKDINFVTTSNVDRDFIHSYGDNTKIEQRYAHNVTIENCTFTNEYDGTVVAARFRQSYGVTIKNCEVNGLFSVLWSDGCSDMTVDNVIANCDFEGLSFGTSKNVEVKNSNITVTGDYGYGVRVDANGDGNNLTVTESTFTADASVVLRYATGKYTAILNKNTLNGDIILTDSNFKQGVELTEATGDITVMLNGERYVDTALQLQKALDDATDGTVILLGADITGNVTVTQKPGIKVTINGNDKTFAGVITVDGKSGTYTTAGLTIQNVNFEADSFSPDACIRLGDGTDATRYTCNVTVDNCEFDVPGKVGVKSYTGGDKNLVIKNCKATENAHSLVQAKGIDGILVEKCEVYSKNGLNFNNSTNVTVSECTVDVKGYAVRFGESSGGVGAAETYLIKNCKLKSANDEGDATIILRGTADNATLTIENTTLVGTTKITNKATNATVKMDGAIYVTTTEQLQAAINSGASKIILQEGKYVADLYSASANRDLTIIGQGADTKLSFSNLQVRLALFDSLTISNCTIERMPNKKWGHLVFGSSEKDGGVYTLSNCIFDGVGTQGIYINQQVAATFNIENCTFNGDFGGEGAITVQNNDGAAITVNVTDCNFNNIPTTSHEIYVFYAYNGWMLNADGVNAYWANKQ